MSYEEFHGAGDILLIIDRQMEEENSELEMDISENGPLLRHADNIIERAMNKYFVSIRGKPDLKMSKVLQRLKKQKLNLPFIDK